MQRRRASGAPSTQLSRPPTASEERGESQARTAYVHHQLEIGKYVADSTKRERLAPQRAARELYISPTSAVGLHARGGPAPPPALPALAGATRATAVGVKRSAGELIEQNRALKQRCEDYQLQTEALSAELSAAKTEISQLQVRAIAAEAERDRLRVDLKHIAQRNEVLERMNETLEGEKRDALQRAVAARAAAAAAPPAASLPPSGSSGGAETPAPPSVAAAGVQAGPPSDVPAEPAPSSAAAAPPPPEPPAEPAQTNSFIHLVERGLTRQLRQAESAGAHAGAEEDDARHARRISLRSQLRQLTAMRTEVHQLQTYADAVKTFSATLSNQLRAKQADNATLTERLREQHAEAEAALRQLNEELAQAEAKLSEQSEAAREWETRAMVAQGSVNKLEEELTASASQLSEMRQHMDQMLTLHEGLSEAAIDVGADAAVAALIEDLGHRLGGTVAMELAGQLDEHLARMSNRDGGPSASDPPSLAPSTPHASAAIAAAAAADAATPTSASRASSDRQGAAAQAAVAKTRTNFMVARRYLLSTRQKQLERESRAASQSPASSARAGSSSQEPSPITSAGSVQQQQQQHVSKPYLFSSAARARRAAGADGSPSSSAPLPPLASGGASAHTSGAEGAPRSQRQLQLSVTQVPSSAAGPSPLRSSRSAAGQVDAESSGELSSRARTRLPTPSSKATASPSAFD